MASLCASMVLGIASRAVALQTFYVQVVFWAPPALWFGRRCLGAMAEAKRLRKEMVLAHQKDFFTWFGLQ